MVTLLRKMFVTNLKREMDKRNLSAYAVAELAGVHPSTVQRILKDEMAPTLDLADAIERGLEIKAGGLFSAVQGLNQQRGRTPTPLR